jgi:hypothetical protein
MRDYLGLVCVPGQTFRMTADEIRATLQRFNRYVTHLDIVRYFQSVGPHLIREVPARRGECDPPQRYGPYIPRAKALP